jgi:hypothetical protein
MTIHAPDYWARSRQVDAEYAAAAMIFDALPWAWQFATAYGLDAEGLLEAAAARANETEGILVRAAVDLFNGALVARLGYSPVNLAEVGLLNDVQFEILLRALRARRTGS